MLALFEKLSLQQLANTSFLLTRFQDSPHLRNLQLYSLSYHIHLSAKHQTTFKQFYRANPTY